MFETIYFEALAHYGGWQNLLDMIDQRLGYYIQFNFFYTILQQDGLHPDQMLDPTHPAYISDAIALRCLKTYSPEEEDLVALERCITDQLHHSFKLMQDPDPASPIQVEGHTWEQYPLDSALRLAWRLRTGSSHIVMRDNSAPESSYTLHISPQGAVLTCADPMRIYELEAARMDDPDAFSQAISQFFRLATEDRGYYIPDRVWLLCD